MDTSGSRPLVTTSDMTALRTLMAGLRRKIEENPAKPRYIMTEIGVGYRMIEE